MLREHLWLHLQPEQRLVTRAGNDRRKPGPPALREAAQLVKRRACLRSGVPARSRAARRPTSAGSRSKLDGSEAVASLSLPFLVAGRQLRLQCGQEVCRFFESAKHAVLAGFACTTNPTVTMFKDLRFAARGALLLSACCAHWEHVCQPPRLKPGARTCANVAAALRFACLAVESGARSRGPQESTLHTCLVTPLQSSVRLKSGVRHHESCAAEAG